MSNTLKLQFASLSQGASVDQQTGNLSVFDLLEDVKVPQVPTQLQHLVVSISLEKIQNSEFQGKLMIHVLMPDGTQQMIGNGDMRIPTEQRRVKAVFRYGNFPLPAFGAYRFVVSWLNSANVKVGEAILDFNVIQQVQVAQGVMPSDAPEAAH